MEYLQYKPVDVLLSQISSQIFINTSKYPVFYEVWRLIWTVDVLTYIAFTFIMTAMKLDPTADNHNLAAFRLIGY